MRLLILVYAKYISMKKLQSIYLGLLLLLVAGCVKENTDDGGPNPQPPKYYFQFTLNGIGYNLKADIPQYVSMYTDEAGGYQVGDSTLQPSVGLRFRWPAGHVVTDADMLGLKGKVLYFNDTAIHPIMSFDESLTAATWLSADTDDPAYSVNITDIVRIGKDATTYGDVITYQVSGSCSALMYRGSTQAPLTNGAFRFVVSCRAN